MFSYFKKYSARITSQEIDSVNVEVTVKSFFFKRSLDAFVLEWAYYTDETFASAEEVLEWAKANKGLLLESIELI